MKTPFLILAGSIAALLAGAVPATLHAAGLTASDGVADDFFGTSVSQFGSVGLVGAAGDTIGANSAQGSAYVFRSLDTATGNITQNVKLTASDGAQDDQFGRSVSQSGSIGLVGAVGANSTQGAAYVFRSLDTATGTRNQDAKLVASGGLALDSFGFSVSLSGSIGLVGAIRATIPAGFPNQGAAYVFRSLNTATGTITENVKLAASDGAADDFFGYAVSHSGNIGLVGAAFAKIGSNSSQGAAYVFRNLDTATGNITQNVKLTASDGAAFDFFGTSLSLSGNTGLVGAYNDGIGANMGQGSAYVFRSLNTATGTITQDVKLTASDGAAGDLFGTSVSLSGGIGLVGAFGVQIGANASQGAAYVFLGLDTGTGTKTQNVKLTASDGAESDFFGRSLSLSGDQFTIGAPSQNPGAGKAYSGSVASVTTLDTGSTSKTIGGISFVSQDDWIIGQATDANQVTLSAGDTGNVTASGKAVYIGKNAGSDNNTLVIRGSLTATQVNVGASGNTGNKLTGSGTVAGAVTVAPGSTIAPGDGIGTLATGPLSLTGAGSTFALEIGLGAAPAADLLNVTGSISLSSSTLSLSLSTLSTLGLPMTFLFAENDLVDPVTGTFATITGVPNGYTATVNYAYTGTDALGRTGTGNDLAVTIAVVPEPSSLTLFGLALLGAATTRRRRTSVA